MRECLGWVTNCTDDKRCPQNWLEHAVTELPTRTHCHVCERDVDLAASEEGVDAAEDGRRLVALPIVPPAGMPAMYGRFATHPFGGAAPAPIMPVSPAQRTPLPPAPQGGGKGRTTEAPPRALYCVLAGGEAIKIDKDSMVIGRSRTCDIVIASAKVSRQHASVSRADGDCFIEDLGSANGVWRSGEKLAGRTKIMPNDVFTISEETLTFELR